MSLHDNIYANWKQERDVDDLTDLAEDFFAKCREYINHLETQAENETDDLLSKIFEKRWQRVTYIFNDLITLRLEKLLDQLINDQPIPDRIPFEEQEFASKFRSQISAYRDKILGISDANVDVEEEDDLDDDSYEFVVFTKSEDNVSIGADLREYGPFKQGDVAVLPRPNVKNFLKRSKVERIEIDRV